jgi:uncharacterized protein Usg
LKFGVVSVTEFSGEYDVRPEEPTLNEVEIKLRQTYQNGSLHCMNYVPYLKTQVQLLLEMLSDVVSI